MSVSNNWFTISRICNLLQLFLQHRSTSATLGIVETSKWEHVAGFYKDDSVVPDLQCTELLSHGTDATSTETLTETSRMLMQ